MNLHLDPVVEAQIETRVKAGGYDSAGAVVAAAMNALSEVEEFGDFGPGELETLLAEGEASGPAVDARGAFAEIEQRRNQAVAK